MSDQLDVRSDGDAIAQVLDHRASSLDNQKLDPPLAREASSLARSARFLATVLRERSSGQGQQVRREHALHVASRQLQGHLLSARAQCEPDRSRDQDDGWKAAAIAAIAQNKPRLAPCFQAEVSQRSHRPPPGELNVKIYVEASGRPSLVTPVDLFSQDTFSTELTWCLMNTLEQMTFPSPKGQAIVQQPFVVEKVAP